MSDSRSGTSRAGGAHSRERRSEEFQASVDRLERAVDQLVSAARTQVSDRAAAFIQETTDRLEREIGRRERHDPEAAPDPSAADDYEEPPRSLYRDPRRQKIGGVCAGIARYYSMEPWVVRCIAVTGLLFFPTIVFPAYWIAYFVMDTPPKRGDEPRSRRRCRKHHGRHDHRSPAPELGPRRSPRYSLRNVQADLTEVELRLRRMETHVTSGQYELQRELNKIDGEGHGQR